MRSNLIGHTIWLSPTTLFYPLLYWNHPNKLAYILFFKWQSRTRWFCILKANSTKTNQSLNLAAEVEKSIFLFSRPQIALDGHQMGDYKSLAIYA